MNSHEPWSLPQETAPDALPEEILKSAMVEKAQKKFSYFYDIMYLTNQGMKG